VSSARETPGMPRELRAWVGPGEAVRVAIRPSWWAVVLESLAGLGVLALVAALVWLVARAWMPAGAAWDRVRPSAIAAASGLILWRAVVVACRRYVLTDRYVLRVAGVFRRAAASVPVGRVQHVVLVRSLLERLTGTGTLGFATAGTGSVEIAWVTVDRPLARLREVRAVVEGAGPVVIGLAGGVGSGKSEVARAMADRGLLVSDSDRAAREALDRPEVRARLVAWWGEGILGDDGRVDRKRVASIVFGDEAERRRLEGLVHPIVRRGRAELLEEARDSGAPGVVVDAPLLFEAGLDAECDAVVFVEAPAEARRARVRDTRGWDEGEMERREKVQLPLDAKRERSDYVVVNDADLATLRSRVERILDRILETQRRNVSGGSRRDAD
jgi:dephospho-CoA kinase